MIAFISITIAVILFELFVIVDIKKAHYKAWKREFERELGESVNDAVIKDLYDQTMPVKTAVEIYKELKEVCEKNNQV